MNSMATSVKVAWSAMGQPYPPGDIVSAVTTPPEGLGIDLMSGAFFGREPHDAYAWMRANAPVYYDEANDLWAAASYAAVKQASVDTESFSNAGGIRPKFPPLPMMIDFDAPEHVRRRRLVSEGFTPRRVRAMEEQAPGGLRRPHRPGLRAGPLRLRQGHRRPAAHHHDRRHARRRPRGPRRPPALVRRHAQGPGRARRGRVIGRGERLHRVLRLHPPRLRRPARTGNDTDLVGVLCHAEIDGDSLDDDSLVHETPPHPDRRRRDDAPRHQRRRRGTAGAPGPAAAARGRPGASCRARSRRCCAGSPRSRTWHGRPPATSSWARAASRGATSSSCSTPRPTATRRCSRNPTASTSDAQPEPARGVRLRRPLLPGQPARPAGVADDVRAAPLAPSRS